MVFKFKSLLNSKLLKIKMQANPENDLLLCYLMSVKYILKYTEILSGFQVFVL